MNELKQTYATLQAGTHDGGALLRVDAPRTVTREQWIGSPSIASVGGNLPSYRDPLRNALV